MINAMVKIKHKMWLGLCVGWNDKRIEGIAVRHRVVRGGLTKKKTFEQ